MLLPLIYPPTSASAGAALQAGISFSNEDGMLSFLPLAHSFDRILEELALCVGAHIGYWRVGGCLPAPMDEWL